MRPCRSDGTRGFTLIELLISMALSGIVMSAIYTLFISQSRSYSIQEQVSEMQQNARVAMDRIVRDVRMAGYGVVDDDEAFVIGNIDYDYNKSDDFQTNNDPHRLNADGIVIRRADGPPIDIITHSGKTLSVCSPSNFKAGKILTITAGNNYQTIEATQIAETSATPCPSCCASGKCDKINFSPGQSAYNNPGGLGDGDWKDGTAALFVETAYFIDVKSDGSPVLKRSINGQPAQTLAENIEDLQIAYQLSGDATWYDTLSPTQQVQDIRSVRINVLARTDKMDPHFSGKRQAIEDHAAGNADKYRRRLLTTVINVRNMGL
ncbi:MAG: PilW family protein [Deltaproteobacteria bacterium]|jgi:type IV pilus assembly protein PilW|nr:PilW family protein [Deltaproteobacteria bacterium]